MQANNGASSLMWASQSGYNDVAIALIDKGADVNMQASDGGSSLIVASQNGHNDVVTTLIDKGADVNMQENDGGSSLMMASLNGHEDVVITLIENGANVNMPIYDGWSSLMVASQNGLNNVVVTLIAKGAEVNMQTTNGWSSLLWASQNGHKDVVATLIVKGADVNMQEENGWSSLMLASQDEHIDIVKVLLANKADTNVKTNDGTVALDIAKINDHKNIVEILMDAEESSAINLSTYSPPSSLSEVTSVSQTHGQYQNVTVPTNSHPTAAAKRQHSSSYDHEKNNQGPPIPRKKRICLSMATANEIAVAEKINPKQLDQPCSKDQLFPISQLLPNWMEYADLLHMTCQEINGINTDPDYTYSIKSYRMLLTWYEKTVYTERCHYRTLIEASRELGHGSVAGAICKIIKGDPSSVAENTSVEHISRELVLFKNEKIGGGAYGAVFKGEFNGQPCAIKILYQLANQILTHLPTADQCKLDTLDRFKKECEYLMTFKHPNVVCHLATATYKSGGAPVLALELMDCNLRQLFNSLSGRELPLLAQRSLCHDVASALKYIHSRKIVHRDLCSDNILLDCKQEPPVAKVCDFGMSSLITNEDSSISLLAFGHKGYLPPEATNVTSTQFDTSYDVFSFGAIMVQIVRRLPTIKDLRERKEELDQIDSAHPLKSIIEECLQEDRNNRPTASKLERRLT